MRFARPAFGVAIIGLAIAVAWYLRSVPEVAAQRRSVGDDAPRPVSPDSSESNAVRPPTIAEAPSDAGVPSVPAAAATASAPTPARAPLPARGWLPTCDSSEGLTTRDACEIGRIVSRFGAAVGKP